MNETQRKPPATRRPWPATSRRARAWDGAFRDVQLAMRALWRAPVFTLSAVVTLALGIGAVTGMFTLLNALMFRPLPVERPGELVSLSYRGQTPFELSAKDVEEYRELRAVFTDVIGYTPRVAALNAAAGDSERVVVEFVTDITSLLGAAGLLLASVGLYGMVAWQTTLRTREIGLRIALGARAVDVVRGVMRQGTTLGIIGVAFGVVLAGAIAQPLARVLVGVSPFDPLTYGVVTALLVAVCVLASCIPAWRASTLDPLTALRGD